MSDINELLPTRPGVKQLLQARLIPWMHALLLPLLILWTSFVFYLHKQLFSFLGLPAFIGFGGMLFVAFLIAILAMAHAGVLYRLVIVGLITFFIDVEFQTFMHLSKYSLLAIFAGLVVLFQKLQKDFYWITAAVFATCLVSTVVAPSANRGEAGIRYSEAAARAADPSLPRIVHLILDEHIGVEGIPILCARLVGVEADAAVWCDARVDVRRGSWEFEWLAVTRTCSTSEKNALCAGDGAACIGRARQDRPQGNRNLRNQS